MWSYTYEKLKVYTRHRARKYREVFFVEEVIDCDFELQFGYAKGKTLFERNITHEVRREMPGDGIIVARHCESLGIISPFIQKAP